MTATPALRAANKRSERLVLVAGSVVVLLVYLAYLATALASARQSFGCDYLTYDVAARAWMAGANPYPTAVSEAGTCGIFQYPPPFLLAVVPFTLLAPDVANWAWVGMLSACIPLAVWAMPVPPLTRLIVLALAGASWPALFAIRIGAVGPLLLLLFALAWRWRDRPGRLAAVTLIGGFAKLMPGLLVGWMALTRRPKAALLTAVGAVGLTGLWFLAQPQAWFDFLRVEGDVSRLVVRAPLNMAPSALAYFGGSSTAAAQLVGVVHLVVVLGVAAFAALRCRSEASVIVAAIASQAVAPVLWDHYAIVVYLAVAWLLARRQWWGAAFGVAMNWMLILWFQPWQWVVLMDGAILAVVVVDLVRQSSEPGSVPAAVPA
jgi:hypothetical protein